MTAISKNRHNLQPSTSKPPKSPTPNAIITATTTTQTNNNSQNPNPNTTSPPTATPIALSLQDRVLCRATHLTRQELLKRRSYKLKQLSRCYRDHYWALMEELKNQYREYYWRYGVSPFKEDQTQPQQLKQEQAQAATAPGGLVERDGGTVNVEVIGENNNGNGNGNSHNVMSNYKGDLDFKNNHRCLFVGCKLKAMALTSFCQLHILSDAKQKLYKPCGYVIKSAQAGPITCGKPILRSTALSLCTLHFQRAQKHVTRALKKAGLNVSSSSKLAPKFHVIVAEYVQQIQAKRRAAKKGK